MDYLPKWQNPNFLSWHHHTLASQYNLVLSLLSSLASSQLHWEEVGIIVKHVSFSTITWLELCLYCHYIHNFWTSNQTPMDFRVLISKMGMRHLFISLLDNIISNHPDPIWHTVNVYQFSSVQSLSHVRLFATPWTAARQASLSITNSRSPPKTMSIVLVMPSNHFILCHPLLLLPSIFPSIRVSSNESVLHIR